MLDARVVKKCSSCKIEKPKSEFSNSKTGRDGLRADCKDCHKFRIKEWRERNKDRVVENKKEYRAKNRDRINEYTREYQRQKRIDSPLYKLKHYSRLRTNQAFKAKSWRKDGRTEELLGATYEVVFKHIESFFINGMTWENHGEWHIDHIIPLSSAKTKEELIRFCHYTNLQPLWAEENISKSDKILSSRIKV